QSGHSIPDQIAIAQPAPFLKINRVAQLGTSVLPEFVDAIRFLIARPRFTLGQNLRLDHARVSIHEAAYFTRAIECEESRFGVLVNFRSKRAKFAFSDGFVRDTVEHGTAGDSADIESEVMLIIRQRGQLRNQLRELDDRVSPLGMFAARVGAAAI